MNSKYTETTFERIDVHHKHMRDCVRLRIRRDDDFLGVIALTLEKERWITLHRVWHQPLENLQQLPYAGARSCRGKADRYQVAFTQRLFEGVV